MIKRLWLKLLLGLIAAILLALAALVIYLTVTEYRPHDRQPAEHQSPAGGTAVAAEGSLTVGTWNIGYAGLGAGADFFMDGGHTVNPTDAEVEENLAAISDFLAAHTADAWLLQEVDVHSARTGYVNQLDTLAAAHPGNYALAYNYSCRFVPIPWPPIGRVESGIATLTSACVNGEAERIALPCPFSWPVSVANLKRCLLVTRLAVEGSDKEVVLVNLHLEAYDDGQGKIAQTKQLMQLLEQEYSRGNYVIAGGDFNQVFPGTSDIYPLTDGAWTPGVLQESDLPTGFRYAFDSTHPTCRLLDRPLDEASQRYVIDGFIVSPNLQIDRVETLALGFANADHDPVCLQVTLLPD